MKNIFNIYKSDLKDIISNKVVLVIVLGLAFLPSLYAWFNIKASWDPYGNTKNLSVAVVNNDKPVTLNDKEINIGDEVIDKLKSNKNLGWDFVDEKTAMEGVNKGTYYASIEIPENFSKNITSLLSKDIKKGEIIYTVNEKLNAIAPKITDKGASTIQTELNQTVVKTVSEVIFEVFNDLGIEIENQLPKLNNLENELVQIQNKFKDIEKTLSLASDATYKIENVVSDLQKDIPLIKSTITSAKDLSSDINVFLNDSKNNLNNISPVIKEDLNIISQLSSNIVSSTQDLIDAINKGHENLPVLIDNLNNKLTNLSNSTNTILEFLKKLSKLDPNGKLQEPINQLQQVSTDLTNAINLLSSIKNEVTNGQPNVDKLNQVLKVANDINGITSSLSANFDSKISEPLNNIFNKSFTTLNNINTVLDKTQEKLPNIESILDTTSKFSDSAQDNIKFIQDKLPLAKNIVDELVNAVKTVNNSDDLMELISVLKNNFSERSDFLEQPIELKTNRLYPLDNYGTGLTPFYTVLSLWVGILLLMSLLSVEVHGDYKAYEIYFGRGLTILTITIMQSFIVSMGDMFILGVKVTNPTLFVLVSIFTSMVFTAIVYSLVSLFSNVGKALAIVLLVIQVAASGGTFPIQVTPEFFQMVNPFLPFTYSISALREIVSGIYEPNLTKDLTTLTIFLIVPIVFTVLLKGPIDRITKPLRDKFKESNLTGH